MSATSKKLAATGPPGLTAATAGAGPDRLPAGPGTSAAHRGVPGTHAPVPPAGSVPPEKGGGTGSALGRVFTLELPAGLELVNANKRYPHPAVRGRVVAEIRKAAWAMALHDKLPPLERVQIIVEYQPARVTRSRDGGNWAPSGKAAIDGLRDARVLEDDDSSRVMLESYRIGQPHPRGRLVLYILEVLA
jgi:hypothetical protein